MERGNDKGNLRINANPLRESPWFLAAQISEIMNIFSKK
jgi:hypothetical protein